MGNCRSAEQKPKDPRKTSTMLLPSEKRALKKYRSAHDLIIPCELESEELITRIFENVLKPRRSDWLIENLKHRTFQYGITNKMYGFWDYKSDPVDDISGAKDALMVRINGNGTEELIDRDAELRNLINLQEHSLAPKISTVFKNGMCIHYIPGVTLTVETIRERSIASKIATLLADYHELEMPGQKAALKCGEPACLRVAQGWLSQIQKVPRLNLEIHLNQGSQDAVTHNGNSNEPDIRCTTKDMLQNCLDTFKKVNLRSVYNQELCFCHNDLVIANILHNQEAQTVHFIDFEYGEWNYAAFDIANHFNEYVGLDALDYKANFPSEELRRAFIKDYISARKKKQSSTANGKADSLTISDQEVTDFLHDVSMLSLQSHLLWAIWAFFQDEKSSIDFDYKDYARQRLQEMMTNAQKLGFDLA